MIEANPAMVVCWLPSQGKSNAYFMIPRTGRYSQAAGFSSSCLLVALVRYASRLFPGFGKILAQVKGAETVSSLGYIIPSVFAGAQYVCIGLPRAFGIPARTKVVAIAVEIDIQTLNKAICKLRVRIKGPALFFRHHACKSGGILDSFLWHPQTPKVFFQSTSMKPTR